MKIWTIIGFITFSLFLYSFRIGIVSLIVSILFILNDIGLFKTAQLGRGYLKSCSIYYIEYTGNYQNVGRVFNELSNYSKEFGSNSMIGIYYDDPQKVQDKNLCRAVVGLIVNQQISISDERLKNLGMKYAIIPNTECLTWYFILKFNFMILVAIKKFYSALSVTLKDSSLVKIFGIDLKKQIISVEICNGKTYNFYVPLKNQESFLLHSNINNNKQE